MSATATAVLAIIFGALVARAAADAFDQCLHNDVCRRAYYIESTADRSTFDYLRTQGQSADESVPPTPSDAVVLYGLLADAFLSHADRCGTNEQFVYDAVLAEGQCQCLPDRHCSSVYTPGDSIDRMANALLVVLLALLIVTLLTLVVRSVLSMRYFYAVVRRQKKL